MGAEFPADCAERSGRHPAEATVSPPRSKPQSRRRSNRRDAWSRFVVLVAMYVFVLPRIASYADVWRVIQRAVVAAGRRAGPGDARQSLDRSAALDHGDAEARLAAGIRRDAGFDGHHLRGPCRRCRRPRGHVRDAAQMGFLERRRQPCRSADGHPERARGARAAGRCAGTGVRAARALPAADDRRNDRSRRVRARRRRTRAWTCQAGVRTPCGRRCRQAGQPRAANRQARAGHVVGRHHCQLPQRRRQPCSGGADRC